MEAHAKDLDVTEFSQIKTIKVAGKGSRTVIVTDPSRAPGVTVRQDDGNALLCSMKAEMAQKNGVLSVDIRRSGLSLGLRCDLTVELVIPQPVSIEIDQPQAVVELDGSFDDIAIDVSKLTVSFTGSAQTFDVKGDLGMVDAVFSKVASAAPQIDINVGKLVADVGYADGAGLDYKVSAPVAMFSRRYPQTRGADAKMRITSNLLKGSVYSVAAES